MLRTLRLLPSVSRAFRQPSVRVLEAVYSADSADWVRGMVVAAFDAQCRTVPGPIRSPLRIKLESLEAFAAEGLLVPEESQLNASGSQLNAEENQLNAEESRRIRLLAKACLLGDARAVRCLLDVMPLVPPGWGDLYVMRCVQISRLVAAGVYSRNAGILTDIRRFLVKHYGYGRLRDAMCDWGLARHLYKSGLWDVCRFLLDYPGRSLSFFGPLDLADLLGLHLTKFIARGQGELENDEDRAQRVAVARLAVQLGADVSRSDRALMRIRIWADVFKDAQVMLEGALEAGCRPEGKTVRFLVGELGADLDAVPIGLLTAEAAAGQG
jgi:hypothetical protein